MPRISSVERPCYIDAVARANYTIIEFQTKRRRGPSAAFMAFSSASKARTARLRGRGLWRLVWVLGTKQNKNKRCQSRQIACNHAWQVFVRIANEMVCVLRLSSWSRATAILCRKSTLSTVKWIRWGFGKGLSVSLHRINVFQIFRAHKITLTCAQ